MSVTFSVFTVLFKIFQYTCNDNLTLFNLSQQVLVKCFF